MTYQKLKPKEITRLDKKLAAVIHVAPGNVAYQPRRGWRSLRHVQILQIAVVADINRRARMNEIGNEKVCVEFSLRWQIGIGRAYPRGSSQQRVVLQNQAQRKLWGELPIPFAAQDVVVEDAPSRAG